MYQPLIPAIHFELKQRNMINIRNVLYIGTGMATVAYFICGIFGFVAFSASQDMNVEMEKQNILLANYGSNSVIKACKVLLLVVILFASPFCVLPSKDSFEELLMKDGKKFSKG